MLRYRLCCAALPTPFCICFVEMLELCLDVLAQATDLSVRRPVLSDLAMVCHHYCSCPFVVALSGALFIRIIGF